MTLYEGAVLGKCHKVESYLGEGGFGIVTKCLNTQTGEKVAIKVNKNQRDVVHQARLEIAILKKLRGLDPDTCNIIRWNGFFFHKDNICLDFELMDQSLARFLYKTYKKPLPIEEVRPIVHQLALALSHLKSVGIIHADFKPENIMIANTRERPLRVKVIDFGLALPACAAEPGACVQTIMYRAPEICLHIPFDEGIDVWGLGLTAAEMLLGQLLYPGYTDYQVLSLIMATQGQPEDYILDRGLATEYYFAKDDDGPRRWRFLTPEEFEDFTTDEPGYSMVDSLDDLAQMIKTEKPRLNQSDYLVVDLIQRMLELDHKKRITAADVLKHPFFAQNLQAENDSGPILSDRVRQTSEDRWQSQHSETSQPDNIQGWMDNDSEGQSSCSSQSSGSVYKGSMVREEPDIYKGAVLGKCHRVESFLGRGRFGIVSKCLNTQTGEKEAIKVKTNDPDIADQAKQEIAILEKLQGLDPDACNIIRWNGFFFHRDNICLNFELMDQSLGDFLCCNNYEALPIEEVRSIVYQLALALSHLKTVGIIHADFKPENIMIANTRDRPFRVKVIDFGLALPACAAKPGTCVQTIMYRAPEISLHIPFDEGIDIWGLGLTAAEMLLGQMLYPGSTDYQVLSLIMETQGQPEDYILDRGFATEYYFAKDDDGLRRWRFLTPEEFEDSNADEAEYPMVDSLNDLAEMIKTEKPRLDQSDYLVVDLIQRMLELDHKKRITAADVLKHPFFAQSLRADNDSGPILSDRVRQTSEDSWQSQHSETSQPDNIQGWMDNDSEGQSSCSSQSSGSVYKGSMVREELDIYKGAVLGKCHRVESFLGRGRFGIVSKCLNTQTGEKEAIKVKTNDPDIADQAKQEIAILEKLRGLDPDACNIIRWNGFFFHRDNICLNFELMDQSLGDFLCCNNYEALPIEEVRSIVYQLALALSHLKTMGIIHADFKPENIMIANTRNRPFRVKVIDFGLALPACAAKPGTCVQTIMYRAPEISLHIPFDEGIDIWGLGLTAAEMLLGQMLYPGSTDYQVLSLIMETQGQPEDYILDRGLATEYFFAKDDDDDLRRWRFLTPEEFEDSNADEVEYPMVDSLNDLAEMIKTEKPRLDQSDYLVVDLIQRMLELDHKKRITAADVLKHPFFAQSLRAENDSGPILSDRVRQTSEDSWQSQHSETSQPDNIQGWMDNDSEGQSSCSSQSSEPINREPMIREELDICPGAVLGKCHRVESFLGQGGFGMVSKCLNTQTGEREAIKVNRNDPDIVRQAKLEIAILKKLRGLDPDACNIIRWNGFFFHRDNICLNFELMEQSLGDFLYHTYYKPLPIEEVRPIVHQLALALSHLKSLGIIHADFKPENIMIANTRERPFRVKVIDFGVALPAHAAKPGVCLQTTMYRAPEITLHIPFDEGIDIWGLGLTAAEMLLGQMLYPGYTDYQVLSLIMATQGQPEDYILDRGLGTHIFFAKDDDGPQRWRFLTPEEYKDFDDADPPGDMMVKSLDDLAEMIKTEKLRLNQSDYLVVDLIQRMLELDHKKRITIADVLKHPFFAQSLQAENDSGPMDNNEEAVPEERSLDVENENFILSDWVKQTSGDSWQSQHSETSQPDNIQGWMENEVFGEGQASCSSQISGNYIDTGPMDSEEEVDPEDRSLEAENENFILSDWLKQTSEDSWQSQHSETSQPDNIQGWMENDVFSEEQASCSSQSSGNYIYTRLMDSEEEVDPDDRSPEVEKKFINLRQSSLPHICNDMSDSVEQASEDSVKDHICINMTDIED